MQTKRIFVAALAVGLFGLALWWMLQREAGPPVAGNPAARESAASAPGTRASSRGSAVIAIPPPAVPTLPVTGALSPGRVALRDEIRAARDLRALYERMKDESDPTGEASYRLAEAIFECGPFIDKPLADVSARLNLLKKPDTPARDAALQWMVARCAGFSGMGASFPQLYHDLQRKAEAAGYPAAVARGLRDEPARNDLARADATAVSLLVAQPDADVLLEISRYLDTRNGGNWLARTGRPDAQTWALAWGFLQCTYGADCGPSSRPVMLSCILMSTCGAATVEDSLLAQGTPYETIRAAAILRDRLAVSLANRDWAAIGFIPLETSQGATK